MIEKRLGIRTTTTTTAFQANKQAKATVIGADDKMGSGSINFFVYTNVPKVANERLCPICGDEAPAGEVHHPHYGGICCYSCRAFFRRANQKSKAPDLKCKNSELDVCFFLEDLSR